MTLSRLMAVEKAGARRAGDIECDMELFEALRAHRKQVADAAGMPPYVIFSDVALRHMARDYPLNETTLLKIPGVGERKLADYGPGFMREISTWLETHPRREFTPLTSAASPTPQLSKPIVNATAQLTLELWRAGKSIDVIAAERKLAASTIEGHLAQAIANGEPADPRRLYTAEEEAEMRAALDGYSDETLKPVFDHLGGRISYGKLKIFRALGERRVQVAG